MNGKAARLLRKFLAWSGVKSQHQHRARKRAWKAMPHRLKGRTRARICHAMQRDPALFQQNSEGFDRFKDA